MPHLQNFTFYTGKFTSGDIITNEQTYIDSEGSYKQLLTTIYDLYDKPFDDNTRVLIGQTISENQFIIKVPTSITYALTNKTFFFKNGSIHVGFNTYNWTIGTLIVATILYGTGEYLGASGFVEFDVIESQYEPCKKVTNYSYKGNFIFTN